MVAEIDERFPLWMQLRLRDPKDIDARVNQMMRLFREGRFGPEDFDYSQDTDDHNPLLIKTEAFVEDELKSGIREATTITHDVEAVRYYSQFYGRRDKLLHKYVSKIGRRARFYQQARISMYLQDSVGSVHIVGKIMTKLRARQIVIDARIRRWLVHGNLAESFDTLEYFGMSELQPFIELALRYTFQPMSFESLKNLHITVKRGLPDDAGYCFNDTAKNAMPKGVKEYLMLKGSRFVHVSLVRRRPRDTKNQKLAIHTLDRSLSLYLFFFHVYCKGSPKNRKNTASAKGTFRLLFTGARGGKWKNVHADLLVYARQVLDLPVVEMGLDSENAGYYELSRKHWLSCQSSRSNIDPATIAAGAVRIGIGFKNEDKYYTGLNSLRSRQVALDIALPTDVPLEPGHMHTIRLACTDPLLDGLFADMVSVTERSSLLTVPTVYSDVPPVRFQWSSVIGNEMFSRHYLENRGAADSRVFAENQIKMWNEVREPNGKETVEFTCTTAS